MRSRVEALENLGKQVADMQDRFTNDRAVLQQARNELFRKSGAARSKFPTWLPIYAGLGAAIGAIAILVLTRSPETLGVRFEHLAVAQQGSSESLRAADTPGAIVFSDGTQVTVAPHTTAKLAARYTHGADLEVENGEIRASIVPTPHGRWNFAFGPFNVRVTGTKFMGAWREVDNTLDLTLNEGSVQLTGCGLSSPVAIVKGQSVTGACLNGNAVLQWTTNAPSPQSNSLPVVPPIVSATSSVPANPAPPVIDANTPADSWRTLARAGRFDDAYALAHQQFEKTLAESDASTLIELADLALYAKRWDQSTRVLLELRRRFQGTRQASLAAFKLGRLAFDQQGNVSSASKWFSQYLAEAPGGELAREAHGRLLECEQRMGNEANAARLAASYLQTYPDGPHESVARGALSHGLQNDAGVEEATSP